MGLVAWARRLVGGGEKRQGPAFDAWNAGRLADISGVAVTPKSALTLAAYFAALNVLSTDLACLPIKVYRRRKSGGRDEVTDDRRADLLATSPDGETTSMRFRQAMLGHTFGGGNGYAEINFVGGEVEGLYWLDPATTPERRSQDKRLYYRLPDGSTRPPYKVLHLAGFGFDGLCGYSVAKLMRDAIRLGKSAEVFGGAFFDNGTQSSGFFEFPHKMDGPAVANWRKEVNAFHQSASNAFKFMILEGGMKFTPSTVPPEDIQFLATRQFQVLEIARGFRLPPHKLMDYSQSHLSNIEESNIDYMMTTLMPWCESIEQEFNRKLFTEAERRRGFYVEHQMQAFLRGNMAARSAFYEKMFGLGVYTPNDIAAYENLNPIGPDGDERFLTVQAKPFRTVLNPTAPAAPPGAPPSGDGPPEGAAPIPANRVAKALAAVAANGHAHAAPRANPNHDAEGKFAHSPSPLASHAPRATTAGSHLEVVEGSPQTKGDAKFAADADAKGKAAFRVTDTPHLDVERTDERTEYRVGGQLTNHVERYDLVNEHGERDRGWQVVEYDRYDATPFPVGKLDRYYGRKQAEREALRSAKAEQKYHSDSLRVATADPEGFVSQAKSAHDIHEMPARFNRVNEHYTTTYYHIKPPGKGD